MRKAGLLLPLLLATLATAGCSAAGPPARPPTAFLQRQHQLSIDGYRMAYVREGRGPSIVLIHGGGTWSYSWGATSTP